MRMPAIEVAGAIKGPIGKRRSSRSVMVALLGVENQGAARIGRASNEKSASPSRGGREALYIFSGDALDKDSEGGPLADTSSSSRGARQRRAQQRESIERQ